MIRTPLEITALSKSVAECSMKQRSMWMKMSRCKLETNDDVNCNTEIKPAQMIHLNEREKKGKKSKITAVDFALAI